MAEPIADGVKKEEEEEEDLFFGSDDDDTGDAGEEDQAPTQSTANKSNGLRFGEVLAAPIPVRYSCEALSIMIKKGQVDLEPEYQRGVVWNAAKQSAVIDSIFRNCYVPPVLFSIHPQENDEGDMEDLRICVDGKQVSDEQGVAGGGARADAANGRQRLSSIYAFMHNVIPLREPHSNRAFWYRRKP